MPSHQAAPRASKESPHNPGNRIHPSHSVTTQRSNRERHTAAHPTRPGNAFRCRNEEAGAGTPRSGPSIPHCNLPATIFLKYCQCL